MTWKNPFPVSHPSSCKEECLFSVSQSPNLSLASPAGKWEREVQRDEVTSFQCSAQDTLSLILTGVPLIKVCRVCMLSHILKLNLTREKNPNN